jgi:hypothetical protein
MERLARNIQNLFLKPKLVSTTKVVLKFSFNLMLIFLANSLFGQNLPCQMFIPNEQIILPASKKAYQINLPTIASPSSTVSFNVCGFVDSMLVAQTESYSADANNYYWHAKLVNAEGFITLIKKNGLIFGYFSIDEQRFDIDAIDTTFSVVEQLAANNSVCHNEPLAEKRLNNNRVDINEGYSRKMVCPIGMQKIRVLVLYTEKAKCTAGSPKSVETRAEKMFKYTVEAFKNSTINDVEFELAAVAESPEDYTDWETKRQAGHSFIGKIEFSRYANLMPSLFQDIRDAYKADICVLFYDSEVEETITGAVPRSLGQPEWSQAFMALNISNVSREETFVHEFGHLLGGGHEADPGFFGDSQPIFLEFQRTSWAALWKYRHTIMASCIKCGVTNSRGSDVTSSRINHFSNPSSNYTLKSITKALGVANQSDHVRLFNITKCKISNYYEWKELDAIITAPNTICGHKILQIHVKPITNDPSKPVTIKWFRETLPLYGGPPIVVEKPIVNNNPDPFTLNYTVVTNDIGKILGHRMELTYDGDVKDFRWGTRITNPCPLIQGSETERQMSSQDNFFDVKIVPNPANDFLQININSSSKENACIYFFDSIGKLIMVKKVETLENGIKSLDLDTDSFANGIYNIVVLTDSQIKQEKLIIQK